MGKSTNLNASIKRGIHKNVLSHKFLSKWKNNFFQFQPRYFESPQAVMKILSFINLSMPIRFTFSLAVPYRYDSYWICSNFWNGVFSSRYDHRMYSNQHSISWIYGWVRGFPRYTVRHIQYKALILPWHANCWPLHIDWGKV